VSCQGWAAQALAAAALGLAACTLGCEYTPKTTLTVRDPSLVRLEVDEGRGDQTIMAPGEKPEETMLPASHPPFSGVFSPATSLRRTAGGPIELHCETCEYEEQILLPDSGIVVFGDALRIRELDWKRQEMKIRFRQDQWVEAGDASFDAAIATPWSNVVSVHRTSTPNRGTGFRLLACAAITGLLGTFALVDAANNSRTTSLALGIPMLVITVPLLSVGGWYVFAPPREQDLYGGDGGKPAHP
jgi:hypothetical protein